MTITKDPCVGCPDRQEDSYGFVCDIACGKHSAYVNWLAGVKTVVEWIEKHKGEEDFYIVIAQDEWQEQLKKWGIKV